jgi:hypothetical protein
MSLLLTSFSMNCSIAMGSLFSWRQRIPARRTFASLLLYVA